MHWNRYRMIAIVTYLLSIWDWIMECLSNLQEKLFSGKAIELDSGIKVRLGRELAQGGYSVVYRGTDASNHEITYAIKCIRCQNDPELRSGCVEEGKVHRLLQEAQGRLDDSQMYCMPLYGMAFEENNTICYMAFPYLPHSLRQEVNQRIFDTTPIISSSPPPPWSESVALTLFDHLCEGVALMHREGLTHRDIKLENVLFQGSNTMHLQAPVLMDFGSAGPLLRSLSSRKDVLEVAEEAGQHTTMPYRPPELFPGELRVGDPDVDYTKVDVWSLGCTLFAILFGASPFECEFTRNPRRPMMGNPSSFDQPQGAPIKIVDCTQLRVLGTIPKPPSNTAVEKWYSPQVLELIDFILEKDRIQRPTLAQVQMRVKSLLKGDSVVDLEDPIEDLFSSNRHQDPW